jgi:hypothetical protein
MWRRIDLVWTDDLEERGAVQPPAHAGSSLADFLPWRWRRYVNPKRRFTQDLQGATSQKTTFFIVTAVKTSNLRNYSFPLRGLIC